MILYIISRQACFHLTRKITLIRNPKLVRTKQNVGHIFLTTICRRTVRERNINAGIGVRHVELNLGETIA